MLRETRLPGSAVCLELTETQALDSERVANDALEMIRRSGARLVLDDFGTAYSSLAYLQRLPIGAVKVDRSFVAGPDGGLAAPEIIKALVALATTMRVGIIAEGVETKAEAASLLSLGCSHAQGFLLSRPLEAAEAIEFLRRHSSAPGRSASA